MQEKVFTIPELGINVQYTYDEASAVGVWNVWIIKDELNDAPYVGCLYNDGVALLCHAEGKLVFSDLDIKKLRE